MLQIVQVRNDLLGILGIRDVAEADVDALTLQDVVIAINGAMQLLQTAGEEFFTRQQVEISLSAGTSFYTLTGVQNVLGPVRWNNTKPLTALESRGQLDQWNRIFRGGDAYGTGDPGDPESYWVESVRNNSSSGNIDQINIWLAPLPASPAGTLVIEGVKLAVAYVVGDLTSTVNLPVPQGYTESVFLPIARMFITRSSQFSRPDILEGITTDYERAMETLGFKGGFPNAVDPNAPQREVKG